YNCTQAELYAICRFIWLMCQEHLTGFADYKSKYTAALILENLALIKTVEAMPNHEARKAPIKDLRKDLIVERTDASNLFKLLGGYCTTAAGTDTVLSNAMLHEAGQVYFDKVNSGSWKEIAGLLTAMLSFVRNNTETLQTNGFMPASFLKRLEDKQVAFEAAKLKWETESEAAPASTDTKITANNDLKKRAMEVASDAALAFITQKAIAQKFVWATVAAQIRTERPTGLGGKITIGDTKKGLANVTVTIPSLGLSVKSDAEGRYEFMNLEAGSYTLEFTIEGYNTVVIADREVTTGVKGRLNVAMDAVAVAAFA
ncbi:MAG: carboxypeptidase regulatory-like domain-containing protein, partial [Saprospiraceae bacterium]|nr:carboxypeptidase regulatory-like domain-containing protein [Saprospiraceae bacterium]